LCLEDYSAATNCVERANFYMSWGKITQGITFGLCGAVLCVLLSYAFVKLPRMHCLPDSAAAILLGMGLGAALVTLRPGAGLKDVLFFDPQFFFLLIIPPIMFDAGYSSNKTQFFKNLGTIITFAVVGTVFAAVSFGVTFYMYTNLFTETPVPIVESMMFGSLISAVDPVATLAIFEALQVDNTLHTLVFGESVLNDAISIALFRTFAAYGEGNELDPFSPFAVFFYVFLGSIVVGTVVGLLSALLFKCVKFSEHPTLEVAMFLLWSYIPFVLCEALNLSGILGVLFVGMTMGHYTHFSLSEVSKITTHQIFRTGAYIAETFCFAYLGLALPLMTTSFVWPLVGCSILLVMASRAVSIFPLAMICNSCREDKISGKNQIVMWFSGLRGAVAFALALSVPSDYHSLIVSTTLMTILFTILVLGGGTWPLLKVLGVDFKDVPLTRYGTNYDERRGSDVSISDVPKRGLWNKLAEFDKECMQPLFRREIVPARLP
jgi:sodium/hydrogen exchanger 8